MFEFQMCSGKHLAWNILMLVSLKGNIVSAIYVCFWCSCCISVLGELIEFFLTCSLPMYKYIIPSNQPKIKQFSCVLAIA